MDAIRGLTWETYGFGSLTEFAVLVGFALAVTGLGTLAFGGIKAWGAPGFASGEKPPHSCKGS